MSETRRLIEDRVSSWLSYVRRWSLEKKVIVGFSPALFFLVLIGIFQYRSMRQIVRNNTRVSDAEAIMSELDGILATSIEAERDCAFYIFTGYLQSYLEAVPRVKEHLRKLEILITDRERRSRLDVLEPLVLSNLERLRHLVDLRQRSGPDAARAAVQTEEGTRLTEGIRNTIRQMEGEERSLLRMGNNAAEAGVRRTAWLSGLAIILGLGILLLSAWVIHLDTAARKQVQEERDRFWTLSDDLIVVAGQDGYFKRLSPSWESTLGFSSDELTTKPYLTFVHPDDRERFAARLADLKTSDSVTSSEVRMLCMDGSYRWMAWRSTLPPGTDTIYAVAHDMTERKHGEAERQELLASMVRFSDDAIVGKDLDGTILSWNQGAERIYGYSAEEVQGKLISVLVPPDHGGELAGIMKRVRRGESVEHFETVRVRKGGQRIDVSVTISPIRDATGKVVGASSVARDITEYKRAQEVVAERARLARFAADVSASIIQRRNLGDILHDCAEAAVRHLDATFARIWTLNGEQNVLELQASAGTFTHLDGRRSHRLVGKLDDISLIVRDRKPRVTNNLLHDGSIEDEEWAQHEGVTAFAGHPLIVDDRVVGVMAMFARKSFTQATVEVLAEAAGGIALGIQRKRAEEALSASEARYRRLFETSQDGLLLADCETGGITDANPVLLRLLGYRREDVLGGNLRDLDPLRDLGAGRDFRSLREGESIHCKDLPLQTRSGDRRDVELISNAYQAGDKKVIQFNIRDITDRKQAQAENFRLATAVEQAAEGVVITDTHGLIQYVNPAFADMTGYSRSEALGQSPSLLRSGQHDLEFYQQLWHTILAGSIWHGEIVNRRKDGSLYPEEMTIAPVRDAAGTIINFIAIKQDITQRKRAEEEIRKLNEGLERRVADRTAELLAINRELEAFTYSVSHDLRAPLRHISGFSKLLRQEAGMRLEPSAQHSLQRIEESTHTMERLIDGLLKLARVSRQDLEFRPTLLSFLLDEVLQELKPECDGREIEWRIGPLPLVECDPGLMKLVLVNLVSNAIKFTRLRRHAVIEVSRMGWEDSTAVPERDEQADHARSRLMECLEDQEVIRVVDNGAGFDMKYADKLFGAFQRLHRAEQFEGTGVGLATVQRIVHRHGGRVWGEAELGKGAAFYFTLPAGVKAATGTAPLAAATSGGGDGEVLLVEDNDADVALTLAELHRHKPDLRVHVVGDGEQALDYLGSRGAYTSRSGKNLPAMVLLDLDLPRVTGKEVLQAMRTDTRTRSIPVVVLSSSKTCEELPLSLRPDGDFYYIPKPLSSEQLREAINKLGIQGLGTEEAQASNAFLTATQSR